MSIMDDSTSFTSNDAASIKRHNLLEQLLAIRSLMPQKGTAADASRDVINDLAKKGKTLNKEDFAALSTEFLLTVLLDVMLLSLLDGGATASSDPQQLMDDAAATRKKKKRAAAKKKRNKRNKAAAKQQHEKTKLMSWLGGGIISVIMMIAFSFISTPIVTLSLFQPSNGSGEGIAPPALPPSASKSLRQKDLQPDDEASNSPDIISPLAAVVPHPIFAPADVSNRDKKLFDEMRESTSTASAIDTDHPTSHNHNSNLPTYFSSPFTLYPTYSPTKSANPTQFCLDTPNWKDKDDDGCDYYREHQYECSSADDYAGDMGPSTTNCCICGGGSHSLPPTTSPKPSSSPTKSATPSSSSKPSSSPTKSATPSSSSKPSSSPTISSPPTQFCLDTPNWEDKYGDGCDYYEEFDDCDYAYLYEGGMGRATNHCCICGGGSHSLPPTTSPKPSSSPTKSATPSSSSKPSSSPTKSATPSSSSKPSSSPTISSPPTQFCLDTPNWEDKYGDGCDYYREYQYECSSADDYAGDMGPSTTNCCICGGGSHSLPPTTSPKPSSSPTKSATPSSSSKPSSSPTKSATPSSSFKPSSSPTKSANPSTTPCLDTPNWKDGLGNGCDWIEEYFEELDLCSYADFFPGGMGPAWQNCCVCGGGSHSLPPTTSPKPSSSPTKSANPSSSPSSKPSSSPTKSATPSSSSKPSSSPSISSSPTQVCFDTPNWEDGRGFGCYNYENYEPDREEYGLLCSGDLLAGDMGPASTHCCICGGGSTTCEDFRSKCQKYINVLDLGFNEIGLVAPLCKEAESCSCEAEDHNVKIVSKWGGRQQATVGLYNECKCDFWSRLCEDSEVGEACDYAAEYCCGDYKYNKYSEEFSYLNSPTCYCDFFNYARNEFGHTLKPKALNISEEFQNPCGQLQESLHLSSARHRLEFERASLEAIYNETDGENWTNSAGWMNETDHCNWHGITCDSDSFVISIDLRDNNLAGQFPVYSRNETIYGDPILESNWGGTKYGLANLFNLKTLDLSDNKLTGTIEYRPLYNLHLLTHFDVSGNQLSGDMDALVTPSLTYVDISNNNFTSMRRFEKYKGSFETLRFCDVSNNAIKHDASDLLENIPPNIERFFASNNQMHGNLPESFNVLPKLRHFDMSSNALSGSLPESFNVLPELRQFDMSSNALSGTLPGFADSILSLQQLDLSNQTNGFTGSIPEDLWRFQSLKILNLAGNKLAGPIPPDIGKMTALEEFDLSNNFLKSIPAELGMLAGTLKRIGLANNTLSGTIPSQLGQLQGAYILLKGNLFESNSIAPLSLCLESEVEKFDLAINVTLCPPERNALSDFYDSTKGAEWTDGSLWLDEYASYCDWNGVTCDDSNRVIKLELRNNGLSGRLSKSIGDLTFIKVLDLSDNDIKGSIPAETGQLSELTYLRLSYNAFTGTAPEGLGKLSKIQLLQLQSNRITEMPNMAHLDKSKYNKSAFVTDCGVPSAFDEAPECEDCTMCCNANDDCYPQEDAPVTKHLGLSYGSFAAVFFVSFIVFCLAVALCSYLFDKRKNSGNTLTASAERRLEEDDKYALSRIGKESVYSYFVADKPIGWLAAFATLGIQVAILVFFVMASEANLQNDTIDIEFTWKCPRDSEWCDNKADLTKAGWFIFSMLMIAFLAKDMINGCKLIYHSSKVRHTLGSKIRYLIGGTGLCSITLFAFYVSTVYNSAIATSNTAIIANSVIVLFIMEIDEYIFSAVDAINEKWTKHAADKEVSKMKAQIESQQEEIDNQRKDMEKEITRQKAQLESQKEEIDNQRKDLRMLREAVEKIQESQAAAAETASDSESAECEGDAGAQQVEQVDQNTMPSKAKQKIQGLNAAAATSSNTTSECTARESITTHAADSEDTGSDTDAGGRNNE